MTHPFSLVTINSLAKKIFIYDSSEADERFFKQALADFKGDTTLTGYMFKKVWERNAGGTTSKYCFFNERSQKIYLDRTFFKWCCMVSEEQNKLKNKFGHTG